MASEPKSLWELACQKWAAAAPPDADLPEVSSIEHIRRLIADGYPVHNEVMDRVTVELMYAIHNAGVPLDQLVWARQSDALWADFVFSDRVPNARALGVRDIVKGAVEAFHRGSLVPPGISFEVDRVMRCRDNGRNSTVVPVHLKPPAGAIRTILVDTEGEPA